MPRFANYQAHLRRTSDVTCYGGFPFRDRTVTLLRIGADGTITQATTLTEKRRMLAEAATKANGEDVVLAAWPGEWSQDVFLVDDLETATTLLG